MTTNADIGHGSTFWLARPGAPTDFIKIAEVFSVGPPKLSRDVQDATHTDSPNRYREFIGGLRDGGEMTVEMNLQPGSASELLIIEAFNDNAAWPAKIVLPNDAEWEANTLCSNYEPAAPMEDKMTASGTFKVSGQPTLTE